MGTNRKVKILDVYYDRENNLFDLLIRDLETNKRTTLSWRGTDLGVTQDVPQEVVDKFCKQMMGQEKNLIIEEDEIKLKASNLKDATEQQLSQFDEEFNKYPLEEIARTVGMDAPDKNE